MKELQDFLLDEYIHAEKTKGDARKETNAWYHLNGRMFALQDVYFHTLETKDLGFCEEIFHLALKAKKLWLEKEGK